MKVTTASRLANTGEYYFSRKLRELAALNAAGANIISLGIGSPDLPPHPSVVAALAATASQPNTHGYQSYQGTPALRQAMADENVLRYNGMLIGVFELLAEARDQIASVSNAINAQQQFWLADAALAASVIGKPTAMGASTASAGAEAASAGAAH